MASPAAQIRLLKTQGLLAAGDKVAVAFSGGKGTKGLELHTLALLLALLRLPRTPKHTHRRDVCPQRAGASSTALLLSLLGMRQTPGALNKERGKV
jgi:hypothetical protein